jgi:hypothetical protein
VSSTEEGERWIKRLGQPLDRTAIFGVPADGELDLALELLRPQVYGAILYASPSDGYNPLTGILLTWRITLLGKSSDALEQRGRILRLNTSGRSSACGCTTES